MILLIVKTILDYPGIFITYLPIPFLCGIQDETFIFDYGCVYEMIFHIFRAATNIIRNILEGRVMKTISVHYLFRNRHPSIHCFSLVPLSVECLLK